MRRDEIDERARLLWRTMFQEGKGSRKGRKGMEWNKTEWNSKVRDGRGQKGNWNGMRRCVHDRVGNRRERGKGDGKDRMDRKGGKGKWMRWDGKMCLFILVAFRELKGRGGKGLEKKNDMEKA